MKLLEYQAHALFAEAGLPALKGAVAATASGAVSAAAAAGVPFPAVVKAQVQIGGRGKAGGIQFAADAAELERKAAQVLGLSIGGLPVRKIFIVPKAEVKKEMYLSVVMDRNEKGPVIVFCADGGMEINEIALAHPEKIVKLRLHGETELQPFHIQYLADKGGVPHLKDVLAPVLQKLLKLFFDRNALLAEVNPLVVEADGSLLCLDGKMDVDDNALYKFPDLQALRDEHESNPLVLDARSWDFLYIPIETDGNIGIISNGSGMLMSSIDLISKQGRRVHSALDLGGGATAERIKEAIRLVLSAPEVDLLFINIFGGITRCDEIANGIAASWDKVKAKKLVLRLEGTNKEEGTRIVRGLRDDIYLSADLVDGVDRIVKELAV